jgi:predicted S18 family serine protease
VKIKYFLWLAKQENLELVCASMIDDYKQRIDSNLELYKNTKVEYLRALQSLKYYLERAKSKEQHIKETELKDKAKILIGQMKFKYCVTSPKSREN